jgi:AcrR family transcriptional regulator
MSMKSSALQADLRVRRTHKLLCEALMAELSERDFAEVTVTDICERAMVHRTTFYKHYEDKYALLEKAVRLICDSIVADDEHRPPSTYTVECPPPYFVRLFEHAAQHPRFYRLVLREQTRSRFQTCVKKYIEDVASTSGRGSPPSNLKFAVPLGMHASYVAGAVLNLVGWWLENGMPRTPRQMAQYLMSPHDSLSMRP